MKKKIALLLTAMMVLGTTACSSKETPAQPDTPEAPASTEGTGQTAPADSAGAEKLIPLGVTFGDLANPVWADCANWMMENGAEYGFTINVVGCDTAEEQIEQVENFLTAGCEGIVVGAKDTGSMGDYMKDVVADGTKVFALGYEIENYTATMLVENYQVGYNVASKAAEWINEHFENGECEVLINDAPEYDVLVDRVKGMEDALAEKAPNARIVNYVSGTTTNEIMPQVENAFTANPDIKVCITIGDGGALACKEAAAGANLEADDFGIFCVDCTSAVANDVNNGGMIRAACSLGGGAYHGKVILETMQKIFAGASYEERQAYPEFMVTSENVVEIAAEQGIELE